MNFAPTGTKVSLPLWRENFEQGPYVIKDESCYRCGISCHKNVYNDEDGKAGKFRAKLDFEPLNLLSSNIGIFIPEQILELCELVDQYCMDSISIGTTLAYVMEYNRRNPDSQIAGRLTFGDFEGAERVIKEIGEGKLAQVGQGCFSARSGTWPARIRDAVQGNGIPRLSASDESRLPVGSRGRTHVDADVPAAAQ